jgi:hypothetical protein
MIPCNVNGFAITVFYNWIICAITEHWNQWHEQNHKARISKVYSIETHVYTRPEATSRFEPWTHLRVHFLSLTLIIKGIRLQGTSPNYIRLIESRRMRWIEHIACIWTIRNAFKIFLEKLLARYLLENVGTDERIILKWILKESGDMI